METVRPINVAALLEQRGLLDLPVARQWMVDRLGALGVGEEIRGAMGAVPRHAFAAAGDWRLAYTETELTAGQTVLSSPLYVATIASALRPSPSQRVLEIGTGSGYQSAVLALLCGHLWTLERLHSVYERSSLAVRMLGLGNISTRHGGGLEGWVEWAPFDAIVVEGSVPTVPRMLLDQLDPAGGRLVVPVGRASGPQRLLLVRRHGESTSVTDLGACTVPPLASGVRH